MSGLIVEKLKNMRKKPSTTVRIVLLGLTPGARQHKALDASRGTRAGSFIGMRNQIHCWFEEIGINKALDIQTCDDLFSDKTLIKISYMTSLLRDPVYFVRKNVKKNYSGRSPKPWKNDDLFLMAEETLSLLEKRLPPGCLIVPMGSIDVGLSPHPCNLT